MRLIRDKVSSSKTNIGKYMEDSTRKNKAWEVHEREIALCCAILRPSTDVKERVAKHLERKVENLNSEVQAFRKIVKGDFSDTGKTGTIRLEIKEKYLKGAEFDLEKAKRHLESCIGEFSDSNKNEFRIIACCCAIISPQTEVKCLLADSLDIKIHSFNAETSKFSSIIKANLQDDTELGNTDKERFQIYKKLQQELDHKGILEILLNKLRDINPNKDWGMSELHGSSKWLRMQGYTRAVARYDSICSRTFERLLGDAFFEKFFMDTEGSPKREFTYIEDNSGDDKDQELEKAVTGNMNLILTHGFDFEVLSKLDPVAVGSRVAKEINLFFDDMTKVRMKNMVFEKWEEIHGSIIKQAKKNFRKEFAKTLDSEIFATEVFGKDNDDRRCVYCDLSESDTRDLVTRGLLFTKKLYCKGATMEVDQKDAYKGYTLDNIVLACYWCNNAKTDEFDFDEWMKVGSVFKEVWASRKSRT